MGDKGNEIALCQVGALDLVIQLGICNRDRSTVAQRVEEGKIPLRVAGTLKQKQTNDLCLAPDRDDDLGMGRRQDAFRPITQQGNLAGLVPLDSGTERRELERHYGLFLGRKDIIISLVRHQTQVIALDHTNQAGFRVGSAHRPFQRGAHGMDDLQAGVELAHNPPHHLQFFHSLRQFLVRQR